MANTSRCVCIVFVPTTSVCHIIFSPYNVKACSDSAKTRNPNNSGAAPSLEGTDAPQRGRAHAMHCRNALNLIEPLTYYNMLLARNHHGGHYMAGQALVEGAQYCSRQAIPRAISPRTCCHHLSVSLCHLRCPASGLMG
jgi:hypothetical protein